MSRVIPFPVQPVLVTPALEGGWLVLAGDHGWLHGDKASAPADAR